MPLGIKMFIITLSAKMRINRSVRTVTPQPSPMRELQTNLKHRYEKSGGDNLKSLKKGDNSVNVELLETLKELMRKFASKKRVPAYVIFSDVILTDMCQIFLLQMLLLKFPSFFLIIMSRKYLILFY